MATQLPVPIVALCGSTKFRAEFTEANRSLTLDGQIVLAPGVFVHDGDTVTELAKARLDELHRAKIDLATWVYVINPGGYIGDSTRAEIAHAESLGKQVRYLVNPDAGEAGDELVDRRVRQALRVVDQGSLPADGTLLASLPRAEFADLSDAEFAAALQRLRDTFGVYVHQRWDDEAYVVFFQHALPWLGKASPGDNGASAQ